MKYVGIRTHYNAYYCNECRKAINTLYIDEHGNKFCKYCIEKESITGLMFMNQNREIIKKG